MHIRPPSYLIERARRINTRLILALDIHPLDLSTNMRESVFRIVDRLLSKLTDYVAGVKIGLPAILGLGLDSIRELISRYREYYYIADLKIADIGYIAGILCKYAYQSGFDAVVSHSIIGLKNALERVTESMHNVGGGVYAVVAMSHEGAKEVLNRNFDILLQICLKANVDGFILPATQPKYISKARAICKDKIILSPGVIYQGAKVGTAVRYGADFEIIGRGIYAADDPVKSAMEYASKLRWIE